MRLSLMIYGSLNTLTGGFLYDKFLVEHLRHKGHTVDVISLPWRPYARQLLDNLSSGLKAKFFRNGYDLILQDGLTHPSLFWLNHRHRKANGTPIVSIVHQVLSGQPRQDGINHLYRAVERKYLTSADAFIFNSETTRSHVQHLISGRPPSIVANPGADRLGHVQSSEHLVIRARRPGPLELLFVGNITPIKGLSELLESLIQVPPHNWRLTVVGSRRMDRKYVRGIRRLISAHQIGRQVRLMGLLNGKDLSNVLADSQLFVMPFSHEGFGIACLEALAYGLPVLASATGAVKEFVRDGLNGFLIPAGNTQKCADLISSLHQDRDHLVRLSQNAYQTALARPGWSDTMDAVHYFLIQLKKQHQAQKAQNI